MIFNKNISGKEYAAQNGEVYLYTLRSDGRFAGVAASTDIANGKEVVTLTGWTMMALDGSTMYQTISGSYIDMAEGWSVAGNGVQYTRQQAQQLVNAIIENNKTIIANNLLCARFVHKLSAEQRKRLYDLQQRLTERNNSLLQDGLVNVSSTSEPAGYKELQQYLDTFMQNGGVGSLTVALVVAAIVVASLSTAAYFAYQYYYKESEQDVCFSNELTKTLTSKLTTAEYEQLKAETQGLVTKAKIQARLGGTGKRVMLLGLGLIAAGLTYKFIMKS